MTIIDFQIRIFISSELVTCWLTGLSFHIQSKLSIGRSTTSVPLSYQCELIKKNQKVVRTKVRADKSSTFLPLELLSTRTFVLLPTKRVMVGVRVNQKFKFRGGGNINIRNICRKHRF